MSYKQTHRFSFLLLPIIYLIDSTLIFLLLTRFQISRHLLFGFITLNIVWFIISYFTKFYEIYRNTKPAEIISKTLNQLFIFDLVIVAFFHFLKLRFPDTFLLKNLLIFDFSLLFIKLIIYLVLKFYRFKGGNIRTYLIVGYNNETLKFKKLLDKRPDFGYKFDSFFGNETELQSHFDDLKNYLSKNPVDVIFCSLKECTDAQIKELIIYANDHFMAVKFIPDNKEILGKNLKVDYFDYFPVLSLNRSPLTKPVNKIIKRVFDLVFSTLIIITVLWWLIPILGLIIKLESKGPILFKQKRNGINYKPFYCYKFRSMRPNKMADLKQVSKNDHRVTTVGRFLRKTSIDELPQFLNVFKGDMSVVGPRPHMIKENERFLKRVDKFRSRHYIKPGITGLAQIKGYRGEVKTDEDIINRIKYDIFYIENWSLWLDVKIILLTVYNLIKGEEKAY